MLRLGVVEMRKLGHIGAAFFDQCGLSDQAPQQVKKFGGSLHPLPAVLIVNDAFAEGPNVADDR